MFAYRKTLKTPTQMNTIIKITYTNYTENVVATAQNIEQIVGIARNDEACKGMEIVQQGEFEFENNFTPKKVANATKKADKLEAELLEAEEALKEAESELRSSCLKLPYSVLRKAVKTATKRLENIEAKIQAHTATRLTAYSFYKMEVDVCCSWEDYK
jgi:hypothetical protein